MIAQIGLQRTVSLDGRRRDGLGRPGLKSGSQFASPVRLVHRTFATARSLLRPSESNPAVCLFCGRRSRRAQKSPAFSGRGSIIDPSIAPRLGRLPEDPEHEG